MFYVITLHKLFLFCFLKNCLCNLLELLLQELPAECLTTCFNKICFLNLSTLRYEISHAVNPNTQKKASSLLSQSLNDCSMEELQTEHWANALRGKHSRDFGCRETFQQVNPPPLLACIILCKSRGHKKSKQANKKPQFIQC